MIAQLSCDAVKFFDKGQYSIAKNTNQIGISQSISPVQPAAE